MDAAALGAQMSSQGGLFLKSVSEETARRRTALKRTAKSCGPGTRGWCHVRGGYAGPTGQASSINPRTTVAKGIRTPGRARSTPSNHCAGKAGCSPLDLYARVRVLCAQLHTRSRVQRAPGLPCALCIQGGQTKVQTSGSSCREIAKVCFSSPKAALLLPRPALAGRGSG